MVKILIVHYVSNWEVSCKDPGQGLLFPYAGVLERLCQKNSARLCWMTEDYAEDFAGGKWRNDSQRIVGQELRDIKHKLKGKQWNPNQFAEMEKVVGMKNELHKKVVCNLTCWWKVTQIQVYGI